LSARREVLLDRLLELNAERYAPLVRWARGDRLALPAAHALHLCWLALGEALRAGDAVTVELLRPWATEAPPAGPARRVAWVAGRIAAETGWPCTFEEEPATWAVEFTVHDGAHRAVATWYPGTRHEDPRLRPELAWRSLAEVLQERMGDAQQRDLHARRAVLPEPQVSETLTERLGMLVDLARDHRRSATVITVHHPEHGMHAVDVLDVTLVQWAHLGPVQGQDRLVRYLRDRLPAKVLRPTAASA
jgi:hypothetical protein